MAAAASDDNAAYGSFAAEAGLSFATVDAVMLLIVAGQAIGVEKIGYRRATQGNGFAQDFLKLAVE